MGNARFAELSKTPDDNAKIGLKFHIKIKLSFLLIFNNIDKHHYFDSVESEWKMIQYFYYSLNS
ncbi:MAG: hypothetical protein NPIRA04_25240 [Nitrospirales bacterium]|nr:MAG: hypothetical protein NPIRA04_25240 [Nitrospirales bacterium]